jgi:F-type H+-transporting ATPase subunit gamma
MATRSKLAALGRQLRASAPLIGSVPSLSGAPAAALPAMSFAAVDTVECAPAPRRAGHRTAAGAAVLTRRARRRLDPFGARHASRQIGARVVRFARPRRAPSPRLHHAAPPARGVPSCARAEALARPRPAFTVKQRMKSVGNIAKITKAMKMVAASRLRGVQVRMEQSRGLPLPMVKLLGDAPGAFAPGLGLAPTLGPAARAARRPRRPEQPLGASIAASCTRRRGATRVLHVLRSLRPNSDRCCVQTLRFPGVAAAKTLVVPITSDKGLCGGINSTVVKYTKVINGVCADSDSEASLYVCGEKGRAQLARGATQKQLVGVLVDVAKPKEGITFASASLVADSLLGTGYEKMHLIYNRFQSVISFKPTVATLLSSSALEASGEAAGGLPFDQYEAEGPDRSEFLLDLSEFHLAATLYNALLENSTSELGSRMQSMENSTKNAQEMLSKLTLYYNRTRQAAITTELIGACTALRLGVAAAARQHVARTCVRAWHSGARVAACVVAADADARTRCFRFPLCHAAEIISGAAALEG